ncbi:MAG: response regulator [Clostridia bacterium]|nr:response regulator [Clostridia bacterium]
MKILLVDDEELGLIRLKDAVKKALPDNNEFLCYTNAVLAAEENADNPIDIAFLDVQMPVLNGFGLAKKLKAVNPKVNIIFVTAYDDYALDAYKMHASGYVTKPVNDNKIKEEIEGLRYPVELTPTKKLQVKCFGNFEVFFDGEPLKFQRSKSKELFAYLIDREGVAVNINELNAILWEEDKKSYCRNLIADIKATLKAVGAGEVFIKRRNECFIDVNKVDCDAYEYKHDNPNAIRAYRGEYMAQYPWAFFKN